MRKKQLFNLIKCIEHYECGKLIIIINRAVLGCAWTSRSLDKCSIKFWVFVNDLRMAFFGWPFHFHSNKIQIAYYDWLWRWAHSYFYFLLAPKTIMLLPNIYLIKICRRFFRLLIVRRAYDIAMGLENVLSLNSSAFIENIDLFYIFRAAFSRDTSMFHLCDENPWRSK